MLKDDFRTRILGIAEVAAAAGQNVAWFTLPGWPWNRDEPDGVQTALRLTRVSPGQYWTHQGLDLTVNPRVQVEVYSNRSEVADSVMEAVRAEMQRLDDVTIGGTRFEGRAVLETDLGDTDTIGDDKGNSGITLYRRLNDFSFFVRPAD